MTLRLLYLAGEPGIGKTTVMGQLTAEWGTPVQCEPSRGVAPARMVWPIDPAAPLEPAPDRVHAIELGRRRRDGFSGTDALPMAVIGDACAYLASGQAADETGLLLVEGARLGNRRFLTTARDAGADVHLVVMAGREAAEGRRDARGSTQNPTWITGRRSAALNLAAVAEDLGLLVTRVEVSAATTPREQASRVARAAHRLLYAPA